MCESVSVVSCDTLIVRAGRESDRVAQPTLTFKTLQGQREKNVTKKD